MKNFNFARPTLITASILLIPLLAMQFTNEVDWTLFDFIVMGILLFGTGVAYEIFASKTDSLAYRGGAALAVLACLLLTWMNLAVGIIDSEDNPVNLMYFAVPAILFLGAIWSHLEAEALARTVFTGSLVLALIPIIALLINRPSVGSAEQLFGVLEVLVLNAFFVVLLIGSGLLFKQASNPLTSQN